MILDGMSVRNPLLQYHTHIFNQLLHVSHQNIVLQCLKDITEQLSEHVLYMQHACTSIFTNLPPDQSLVPQGQMSRPPVRQHTAETLLFQCAQHVLRQYLHI